MLTSLVSLKQMYYSKWTSWITIAPVATCPLPHLAPFTQCYFWFDHDLMGQARTVISVQILSTVMSTVLAGGFEKVLCVLCNEKIKLRFTVVIWGAIMCCRTCNKCWFWFQLKTQLTETLSKLEAEESERQKVAGDLYKVRMIIYVLVHFWNRSISRLNC